MQLRNILFILVFFYSFVVANPAVDMVVFSFDRPMQLYAFLESVELYILNGLKTIQVLCRASNSNFKAAYEKVHNDFPHVQFIFQSEQPRQDFKLLTERAINSGPSEYLIFAVDDIIIKDYVDISLCIQTLEKEKAYGFYLRLGKNLSECYMLRCKQPLPRLNTVAPGILSWQFNASVADWNYPNTTDMTIYRKKDVISVISLLNYNSPNTLESQWDSFYSKKINYRRGLCFDTTKVINVPLNLVQQDYTANRNMNSLSTQEMLDLFNKGLKIDIRPLHKINNHGAHMEYQFTFVKRDA